MRNSPCPRHTYLRVFPRGENFVGRCRSCKVLVAFYRVFTSRLSHGVQFIALLRSQTPRSDRGDRSMCPRNDKAETSLMHPRQTPSRFLTNGSPLIIANRAARYYEWRVKSAVSSRDLSLSIPAYNERKMRPPAARRGKSGRTGWR